VRPFPLAAVTAAVILSLALPSTAAVAATTAPAKPSPSPSSTGASAPAQKVTFGIGAATGGRVDRRSSFALIQARGTWIGDQAALVYLSNVALTMTIYVADAYNASDGSLSLQSKETKPTDLASWVTLRPPGGRTTLLVPAKGTVIVPFSVKVPTGASVGDHTAGIVASITAKAEGAGGKATDIDLEQRVAMRLGLRVAGVLKPELTVENLGASYLGSLNPIGTGTAEVSYMVRNTGNVRLGGRQNVSISGLVGRTVAAENVPAVPELLPGGSARVTVEIPGIAPLFFMTAIVTVTPTAPTTDANPPGFVATASAHFWAVPWMLLAIVFVLIGLVGWWWRRRRMVPTPSPGRRERGGGAGELVTAGSALGSSENRP